MTKNLILACKNFTASLTELRGLLPGISDDKILTVAPILAEGGVSLEPVTTAPPAVHKRPKAKRVAPKKRFAKGTLSGELRRTLERARRMEQPFLAAALASGAGETVFKTATKLRLLRERGLVKHASVGVHGTHSWIVSPEG